MINVSPEVRAEYLADSVNKSIKVRTKKPLYGEINFYEGAIEGTSLTQVYTSPGSPSIYCGFYGTLMGGMGVGWHDSGVEAVDFAYAQGHKYVILSADYRIGLVSTTPTIPTGTWRIEYHDANDVYRVYTAAMPDINSFINNTERLILVFPVPSHGLKYITAIMYIADDWFEYTSYTISQGAMQVNFTDSIDTIPDYAEPIDPATFDPVKDVGWEISNESLIYEDFTLTESLCSKNNIKFGLCEAAHIDFGVVSDVYMAVGDELKPSITTRDEDGSLTDSDIFAINWIQTTRESSTYTVYDEDFTGVVEVVDVNAGNTANWAPYVDILGLSSKYIHAQWQFKFEFNNLTGTKPTFFTYGFRITAADGSTYALSSGRYYSVSEFEGVYNTIDLIPIAATILGKTITGIDRLTLLFLDENKAQYSEGMASCDAVYHWKDIQYRMGARSDVMLEWSSNDLYNANGTVDSYIWTKINGYKIPLGVFTVSDIINEYRHNLIKRKVTAYDRLLLLEQNAADWYTQYMYGVDFNSYSANGFQFARQIFSTYWNYVTSIGLDSIDNYTLSTVAELSLDNFKKNQTNCYGYVKWTYSNTTYYRCYGAETVAITDNTLLYRVTYRNNGNMTDKEIMEQYNPFYVPGADTIWRGFGDNGGVLIEEYRTGANTPYNAICVNRGDFFMLSPETASIKVILPSGYKDMPSSVSLCMDIVVQSAPRRQALVNGCSRLLYYNWGTKEIFACDSSITGRDVVRSLLEVCGCFFRLDRYNGLPEFVYPQKGGLYPSNTLYPDDDLYPRGADAEAVPMGKYISLMAADYTVRSFGRIQILKDSKSSETQSVVEWQYEGDPHAENTYIIDDNIFYCADGMMYDYDGMPEVSALLENMWIQISSMGYVPHDTEALGAPWIECGDRISLLTFNGGFESFIFRRTLKGIQNLRDSYEAEGDEINEAIDNYGYIIYSV